LKRFWVGLLELGTTENSEEDFRASGIGSWIFLVGC
jgi:hypothetical protein